MNKNKIDLLYPCRPQPVRFPFTIHMHHIPIWCTYMIKMVKGHQQLRPTREHLFTWPKKNNVHPIYSILSFYFNIIIIVVVCACFDVSVCITVEWWRTTPSVSFRVTYTCTLHMLCHVAIAQLCTPCYTLDKNQHIPYISCCYC